LATTLAFSTNQK